MYYIFYSQIINNGFSKRQSSCSFLFLPFHALHEICNFRVLMLTVGLGAKSKSGMHDHWDYFNVLFVPRDYVRGSLRHGYMRKFQIQATTGVHISASSSAMKQHRTKSISTVSTNNSDKHVYQFLVQTVKSKHRYCWKSCTKPKPFKNTTATYYIENSS